MRVLLPQLRKLLLLLFTISTVLFVLLRQAGDPAYVLAGATATPEQIEAIRQQFGLDGPLFAQYLSYLWNLLQLDFGESLLTGDSALLTVLERLPRRLQLALMAIVLSIAVAIPTGAWLGSRPGQPGRRLVSGLVFVLQGSPGLVLALLLIQLFAVEMMWLPSLGHGAADWKTRALPTLSLAMCSAPSLRPGLGDLFIRLAVGRSSGGPRNLVLFPEFALTGFPLQESAAEWIEKHLHRRQCLRARSSVAGPLFQLLLPDRPFRQRDPEMQAREYGQCAVAARFHGSLFRPLWRRGRVPGRQDRARQHRRDSLRRDHVSRGLSRADVP